MDTRNAEASANEDARIRRLLSALDAEERLALLAAVERGRGGNMEEAMKDFVAFCERRQPEPAPVGVLAGSQAPGSSGEASGVDQ